MFRLKVCLFLFALCIYPLTSVAEVPRYDAFYVFGDSLSDTGNDLALTILAGAPVAVPPSVSPHQTYYRGRFSNGPVAFEYLWQSLAKNGKHDDAALLPIVSNPDPAKKSAINFAFGGAGSGFSNPTAGGFSVPGLLGQVEAFRALLGHKKPKGRALYAIWVGSNDYILGLTADPTVVVGNIASAVEKLYTLGARDFLVLNQPDLGLVPLVQAQGAGAALSQLSAAHNALLAQALNGLSARLAGSHIVQADVYAMTNALLQTAIAAPAALDAAAPGASFCLFVNPLVCPDVSFNVTQPFFFWDAEHPTTYVHSVLATNLLALLNR